MLGHFHYGRDSDFGIQSPIYLQWYCQYCFLFHLFFDRYIKKPVKREDRGRTMASPGPEETADHPENPDTLVALCTNYCVNNLQTFCHRQGGTDNCYTLNNGVQLPTDITEALLNQCREIGILNEGLLHAFIDPEKTKVQRLNLNGCNITDRVIRWFMPHRLTELNISNCNQISNDSLTYINQHGDTLISLFVGNSWGLFLDTHDLIPSSSSGNQSEQQILRCPHLKAFSVQGLFDLTISAQDLLSRILTPNLELQFLDLSGCRVEVESMVYLGQMETLRKLILHDVPIRDLPAAVRVLRRLRNLR